MMGLAVGDALGLPAEFRKRRQILSCFGPDGITEFVALHDHRGVGPPVILSQHLPGNYSDDTQMSPLWPKHSSNPVVVKVLFVRRNCTEFSNKMRKFAPNFRCTHN
jgi:hypothetical protein